MLNPEDRRAIDGLFQRLEAVERAASEPRDPDAEALIARRIAQQPAAPYYMAQTLLVHQRALEAAEQRIEELERQLERGRSMLPQAANAQNRYADEGQGPWNRGRAGAGGGFLAGAMQTALGVTGGILLGHALGGLLFGETAHAGEPGAATDNGEAGGHDDVNHGGDLDAGDSIDVADAGLDGGGFGDFDFGDF